MAAAWMNVVYGFGGLRSDGDRLIFNPSLPAHWQSFQFRLRYRGSLLEMRVDREGIALRTVSGEPVPVRVYGNEFEVGSDVVSGALPAERRGHDPVSGDSEAQRGNHT
jgi:maltose phosphorylase